MKIKISALLVLLLTLGLSTSANAFLCYVNGVISVDGGGGNNVYVNLDPSVQVGQNIVVHLGNSISCKNLAPADFQDPIRIISGQYTGPLNNLTGSITYYGASYDFPINTPTITVNHTWGTLTPWDTVLFLKVIGSGASGITVNAGQMLARLTMEKVDSVPYQIITWNIYANNTVVVPTGGCDVSSRNVTVTLPDYPGSAAVPLNVHCAQNQNLSYFLTGPTTDSANTTFSNTASASPASGIGVQLSNASGVIATNHNISLGSVGVSPVELGMTASYARTGGQVVAGNVQSVIGVTFVYQ
ncbi:fimbrial protein [Pseudomonas sp. ADAK13]|jgi:minor fimbrial subunit|uniref:fimbrial protein n=1 Tax=Pseudomonas sp. ADAK13 TaxID=2730847 RepID=UPI00146465EB|nr:fimbrial protein [Pseudomonas sp. ADAK13]QJI37845.1 fimbrial protein [Pseudomonas sp. ADAK13]